MIVERGRIRLSLLSNRVVNCETIQTQIPKMVVFTYLCKYMLVHTYVYMYVKIIIIIKKRKDCQFQNENHWEKHGKESGKGWREESKGGK